MEPTEVNNRPIESAHFSALYPAETRFAELQQIITYIKQGNSCQVVSIPGVGRANLFGLLSYNRSVREKHLGTDEQLFHFVTINFSEIKRKPIEEVIKFLFLSLVESLQERKLEEEYQKAYGFFKDSMELQDELVLFAGLKKTIDFLALEKQFTIVFLFDRFDEYVPNLTPEFFEHLRTLRNRVKYHFSIVLSINRPLEDLIEPALFAAFHEFIAGNIVYIPLLDKPGLDFRISYIEKAAGATIEKGDLDILLQLTGGHGKLTRLSLDSLLTTEQKPQSLESFLLDHKSIQGALKEIIYALTPAEQTHIVKHLFAPEYEDEHTRYLQNVDLVRNNMITIPLLEEFAKSVQDSSPTSHTSLISLTASNDILKNGQVLSDRLTPTEFKLLKYLLTKSNQVIEREEIISNVWDDAKSTAGVTDQALDQLIFRLRKKIESDPNNPMHLQTVKGRGLRFNP